MKDEKRILIVAQRMADGHTECIVTDKAVSGARVVASMKAASVLLQVGKSKIRMGLVKKKKKEET